MIALSLLGLVVAAAWGWSHYHTARARHEAAGDQLDLAWAHLEKARWTWPARVETHLLAARLARRQGKGEQARHCLSNHARAGGDSGERDLEISLLLAQEGRPNGADGELVALVQSDHPRSGEILEALARGYLTTNHADGLAGLLRIWPDHLPPSEWRGQAQLRLGNTTEAIADLTAYLARHPMRDDLRIELARACHRAGRVGESLAHWRYLARRDSASAEVLLGLGTSLQDESLFDEAAAVLDRLLEQAPDDPGGLVERARVAFRQGQPQLGERLVRKVVEAYPTAPDPHLVLALCLEAQGRKAEADGHRQRGQSLEASLYHLNKIIPQIARTPDDANLHHEAGTALLRLGMQEKAKDAFGQALRLEPTHRLTHRRLAEYYDGLGKAEIADEHRRQAEAP